ncbi:uncharacterized protein L969DRAFT_53338 [Mixia osmundae IAM 14324]|uniref:ABC transporter domain-containing protein n=1 Tax=Mixia osmundae (strain CBS 9802 / IAM 14324 / JCM 22182 / KY 12970) TaxID=764103 RepID=G7DX63_MIXOS|nr:uncharacterized protein L969DRAFT_53338 [Mixia osmundae IAM 14324]KEI37309.1 hypothetical protein L969DRAFT_53338 [Mixia osmundae IAM 14324]GAA95173.1 hypothetical protein E5Q_01828 [Mixia osmundae IAM 14324]
MRAWLIGLAVLRAVAAQTCTNGGYAQAGACVCPPGLTGPTCATLACGNPVQASASRPAIAANAGGRGCAGTGACSSGFTGLDCNLCTSAQACSAALGTTSSPPASSALSPVNTTVTCHQSPLTFTEGFTSCGVINPTLQAVFPGSFTLNIQRSLNTSQSLSSAFGSPGTALAQLWFSNGSTPQQQFYCSASSCTQTALGPAASPHNVTYDCDNLSCNCIPGSKLCGGGGPLDLTATINGLSGPLGVDCDNTGSGTCYFKQAVLQSLFGQNGLGLSNCQFGECVRQNVIDTYTASIEPTDSSLSGGVIAGLAVLGAVIASLMILLLVGLRKQAKARRIPYIDEPTRPVGLSWQNLTYHIRSGSALHSAKTERTGEHLTRSVSGSYLPVVRTQSSGKAILSDVSATVPAGSLLAVMGESGAGKSTLLDILAGRRKAGTVRGKVDVTDTTGLRNVNIAYVDQEDILPAHLTVREALRFAATLKMPENAPRELKEGRIGTVMAQLGLTAVSESRIGSGESRSLSGGERRRLSIALELIARPSILICDEPTSGLDASNATRVVEMLHNLSQGDDQVGRTTVIISIHQPSSRIFQLFDYISLLAVGGRQIYFGPAQASMKHFADLGMPCAVNYNPADHLLEIASADVQSRPVIQRAMSQQSQKEDEKVATSSLTSQNETTSTIRKAYPCATFLTQIEALSRREAINLRRDLTLGVMHNLVAICVGLLVGGLFYNVDDSIAGFQSRVGSLFFLGTLLSFSALSALSTSADSRRLFLRERASAYYSPFAWLLSRIMFDMIPLRLVPATLLGLIVYWMVGLSPHAAEFFKFLLIVLEFSIAITLFNFVLGLAIRATGVAILLSAITNLFQMALAGFFINLPKVPGVLRWLQWLDPLRYTLEALAVNEVTSGLSITDEISGVPISVSATLIMKLLFGFSSSAYYRDVLVMFAFIALFGTSLLGLVWRLHEIR